MSEKISIYDIARYCNLSVASVSYVINGKKKVSDETRKRVMRAIKELGYHPNYTARALSTGKSNLIGIILPLKDASIAFLQNPFYVEFIGGIEKVLAKHGYDIVITIEFSDEKIEDWLRKRSVDGIVLIGSHNLSTYQVLKSLNIPTVLIDDESDYGKSFNNVRSNDEEGIYQATKYLIEHGHTSIGFVGNKDIYLIDSKRYAGYEKAMKEFGLSIDQKFLYYADATLDEGVAVGQKILEDHIITACICSADIQAMGIISAFKENNKMIPDDLSIIGFDDIKPASIMSPSLTTVHQDIGLKGQKAGEIFLDIFENSDFSIKNIVLDTHLVERNSVKKR